MKIFANRKTLLKKSETPVQGSELPANLKHEVAEGSEFNILAHKEVGQDHYLVSFDHAVGGYNTWLLYGPHWDGLKPKFQPKKAKWFPQTDNSVKPSATCNISACASFASVYRDVKSDEELIREVFHKMGAAASTDHTLLTFALKSLYGLDTVFDYTMTWNLLNQILDSGQPVVLGILHHGTNLAPYGGGHMICAVGRSGSQYTICDPWGSLNDSYQGPVTNGNYTIYSKSMLDRRWQVDKADGCGWGRYLRDWKKV